MVRSTILRTAALAALALACEQASTAPQPADSDTPALARTPATGNGPKVVELIDEDGAAIDCGAGDVLALHFSGWVQFRVFDEPVKRNVELDIFHVIGTYTNSAGDTFVFRDVGPDHFYLDADGNLIVAASGRQGARGLIGHIVINITTGETGLVAGKQFAGVDASACEALT
jgi:hypothetical protein